MKKLSAALCCALLASMLCACGKADAPQLVAHDPTPTATPVPQEIKEQLKAEENAQLSGRTVFVEGEELETWLVGEEECLKEGEKFTPLSETGMGLFEDEESGRRYLSASLSDWEIPENLSIPVIRYYGVCDYEDHSAVEVAQFRQELNWLLENGYTPIFFEDLQNLEGIEKPVIITFELCREHDYSTVLPVIQELGVKISLFPVVEKIGKSGYLNEEQLAEMSASGLVMVECGAMTSKSLEGRSSEALLSEISGPRAVIAGITGIVPIVYSFPESYFNDELCEQVSQYYKFAVAGSGASSWNSSDSPFGIKRIRTERWEALTSFSQKFE